MVEACGNMWKHWQLLINGPLPAFPGFQKGVIGVIPGEQIFAGLNLLIFDVSDVRDVDPSYMR